MKKDVFSDYNDYPAAEVYLARLAQKQARKDRRGKFTRKAKRGRRDNE